MARVAERTMLTRDTAMVTLNPQQSAIGSLVIDVSPAGTLSCVWELVDGTSGIVSAAPGFPASPEFGKRALVQIRKGQLIIGLRHVRELRRLLVVVSGSVTGGPPTAVVLSLHDGATIESSHTGTNGPIVAVAGYQVGGELVIRREGAAFSSVAAAAEAYGFAATWTPPPPRGSR